MGCESLNNEVASVSDPGVPTHSVQCPVSEKGGRCPVVAILSNGVLKTEVNCGGCLNNGIDEQEIE